MKSAIILGATGLTGSLVLKQLLENDNYNKIKLISRSSAEIDHPKIQEHLGDLFAMEQFSADFIADEVYVCIGTTKKKTPDRETYRKIDIGIPVNAAKLAKKNGIQKIAVVSAIGANAKSSIQYNRIKGEMEEQVMNVGVPQTFILRPSMIAGDRKEHRTGEKIGIAIFKALSFLFFGPFRKYRVVEASAIASKMIALCNSEKSSQFVESDEIPKSD